MQMEQEIVDNAIPPYPKGCTPLQDSLYFRVRNKSQPLCEELMQPQADKVKYLHNEYLSILFQQQIVGLNFNQRRQSNRVKKRAKNIQTIIISLDKIDKYNKKVIIRFFDELSYWNPQINILLITNQFGNYFRESTNKLFKDNNILIIQSDNIKRNVLQQWKNKSGYLRAIFTKSSNYATYGKIHGKLWLVKYKTKKLRVCVTSANLSSGDWTVGGNAFWKKDFGLVSDNPTQKNNQTFRNRLNEFMNIALTQQFFQFIGSILNFRLNQYCFSNVDNVHLIITPLNRQIYYTDRALNNYGLYLIKNIIKKVQKMRNPQRRFKNINIISPYISTGQNIYNQTDQQYNLNKPRHRRYFRNLLGCIYQAFNGETFYSYDYQPTYRNQPYHPSIRRTLWKNRRALSSKFIRVVLRKIRERYKRLRIYQLTNQEVYKATKYQLQTKLKTINRGQNYQFDVLSTISSIRRNQKPRSDAIQIIKQTPEIASFYRLQTQDTDRNIMKFSNFTAYHTKIIASTHYNDETGQKIPDLSNFLYIGSNNFTPRSFGLFKKKSVQYCHLQLGVLIQVYPQQIITQFIPIKFITSNRDVQMNQRCIQDTSDIFTLQGSYQMCLNDRRANTFMRRLEIQQICWLYRKKFQKWFRSQRLLQYNSNYQIQIHCTLSDVQWSGKCARNLTWQTYKNCILNGELNLLQHQFRIGEENIKNIIWIADMALINGNGQICIIWYFDLPIFAKLTQSIKSTIAGLYNENVRYQSIGLSNLKKFKNRQLRQEQFQSQLLKISSLN